MDLRILQTKEPECQKTYEAAFENDRNGESDTVRYVLNYFLQKSRGINNGRISLCRRRN